MNTVSIKPYAGFSRNLRIAGIFLVLTLCGISGAALAWNGTGHRLVAAIAWEVMTPTVRAETLRLLGQHPDHERWQRQNWVEDAERLVFLACATWPDEIRKDARFYTAGQQTATPLLAGFPDMARHSDWHTEGRPLDPLASPSPPAPPGHLSGALRSVIRTLGDGRSEAMHRSYALPWLIHLAGDAHQPLHLSLKFNATGEWDHFGTGLWIEDPEAWRTPRKTLHAFWDDTPGPGSLRGGALDDKARQLMRQLPVAAVDTDAPFDQWLDESWEWARRIGYPEALEDPPRLSEAFREHSRRVANQRVVEAGYRLGRLLNQLLGEPALQTRPGNF